MEIISVEEWAERQGVPRRKAYRWVKSGKLPTAKRKLEVIGVPANITKEDLVK